ncbi:MAG: response regulator [Alphaproteobacteria bacterium]
MMEENNKLLDKHVGHKIKERRKILGLTQAELADILGLSHQQIQRYESGENTVSMSRMLEIADGLNIKAGYFYENAPLARPCEQKQANGIITKVMERPLRILLVEDTSSDELLFRKAVSKSNIEADIHVITNPENVMDFLHNHQLKYGAEPPDIAIVDINLPRINGLMLLKKIKSDHQWKSLPVIMLTNSIRSKDMQDAYANHANGFIQKNSDLLGFYEDVSILLQYWSKIVILPSAA